MADQDNILSITEAHRETTSSPLSMDSVLLDKVETLLDGVTDEQIQGLCDDGLVLYIRLCQIRVQRARRKVDQGLNPRSYPPYVPACLE